MTTVPTRGRRAQPKTSQTGAAVSTPFGAAVAAAVLAQVPQLAVPPAELADICTAAAIRAGILPARCATHDWCTETGEHRDHYAPYIEAPTPDGLGDPVLMATLLASNDETPKVSFLDTDLTPDETRARVAELRAHLDKVEALADTLDGIAPLDPAAEAYSVEAPGASAALLNATVFESEAGAALVSVWGDPCADADLDAAGTDQLIGDLEQFVSRLRALRDHVAQDTAEGNR
ncbi:hypothetical protein [Streptomyces sp. DH12]|uniref:hypothetical protein n=1 Tax=Streptomyces sp. DH12 TaxID=2857010 RepID=UPI001E657E98|nr:hypothetical protein [Streptomyces sp. DH12]